MANKLRVVIIDDDPAITLMLKAALSKLDHYVLTFPTPSACPLSSGESCTCPQDFPCADVIITDIIMPHMSGIDFFKLQKEKGCKALETNKAFLSATTIESDLEEVKELGYKLFTKPFNLSQIVKWVNECAERVTEGQIPAKLG